MLEEIGSEDNVDAWVENALAQKKKIMGIGHRVYKVLDPRAPHLRDMAIKLSNKLGEPKWIKMSERIAAIMKERKGLNANVDFYSATVYYSLGIPTDLFTPVFAIARTSGWTAHVLEQLVDNRLYRPLSEYVWAPRSAKKSYPISRAVVWHPPHHSQTSPHDRRKNSSTLFLPGGIVVSSPRARRRGSLDDAAAINAKWPNRNPRANSQASISPPPIH